MSKSFFHSTWHLLGDRCCAGVGVDCHPSSFSTWLSDSYGCRAWGRLWGTFREGWPGTHVPNSDYLLMSHLSTVACRSGAVGSCNEPTSWRRTHATPDLLLLLKPCSLHKLLDADGLLVRCEERKAKDGQHCRRQRLQYWRPSPAN